MENLNEENSQQGGGQTLAGKILLWVLALLILGSVGVTYWRIMIKKDYVVEAQVDCDPYEKNCFVWECDPNSIVEGEACTGDPENDIWYYAVAKRTAAKVPLCDPATDDTCDPWTCEEGEKDCSETLCDETTKVEQEAECNDPVQYAIDNPEEEEAVECEEGDEECLVAQEETADCEEGDEECLAAQEESEDTACDVEKDPTCEEDAAAADSEEGADEETATPADITN